MEIKPVENGVLASSVPIETMAMKQVKWCRLSRRLAKLYPPALVGGILATITCAALILITQPFSMFSSDIGVILALGWAPLVLLVAAEAWCEHKAKSYSTDDE